MMAIKLSTTLSHITTVPNSINSNVISEFYQDIMRIETSEKPLKSKPKSNH